MVVVRILIIDEPFKRLKKLHEHLSVFEEQPFTDVLQINCSYKFCKFHREAPVMEFLFNPNLSGW